MLGEPANDAVIALVTEQDAPRACTSVIDDNVCQELIVQQRSASELCCWQDCGEALIVSLFSS